MSKTGIVKPWKLIRTSVSNMRRNWWTYVRVVLLVQIPLGIFSLWLSGDSTFGAYSSIITVIMNMALIYTIATVTAGEARPTFKQSFYTGTSRFVPYLLTTLALVVILIPALLGITIYSIAAVGPEGVRSSFGQQLFGAIVGMLLALPSLWIGTRWVFAPYAVMLDGLNPVEAIKASRNLTLGNFWKMVGRIVLLSVIIMVAAFGIAIPTLLIGQFTGSSVVILALFQLVSTCIVLPFTHIYLLGLYSSLKSESA